MRAREHTDPASIGRYRILARIGAGGMAIIYFGRSAGGRAVAIKVMHRDFATDREHREHFRREVAATMAAGGRYSPGVLDADPDAAIPWLATEFLPSVSLRDTVRAIGPLPTDVVWPLAAGLAEAIGSIHRAGVLHLDLTPANVLLTADGPRVIDFGIAESHPVPMSPGRTPAGARGFLSPEQEAGAAVGPASDVFTFGATLTYVCTGAPPNDAGTAQIADEPLRQLITRCLSPDPAARPTVPELTGHLVANARDGPAGPLGAGWLPDAVLNEINRRAGEADNPPAPSPAVRRGTSRRTLLLTAGATALAGAAAGVLVWPREQDDDPAAPQQRDTDATPATASRPTTPPPAESSPAPTTRTLEFFVFGTATVTKLTTAVTGDATTVRDVTLPYRRTVDIPTAPPTSTWRITYSFSDGTFNWRVLVDGVEFGTGGGFSNSADGVVNEGSDGAV